jgi:hypothetical protein
VLVLGPEGITARSPYEGQGPDASGLGSDSLTPDDVVEHITQRKRDMLERALRPPIPSSAESASAPGASSGPEACDNSAGPHDDELQDDIIMTQETQTRWWDYLDHCMMTLLRAKNRSPKTYPPMGSFPPSYNWLLDDSELVEEWRAMHQERLQSGIVLDTEAVLAAVEQWDELQRRDPDQANLWSVDTDTNWVMEVVRAAAREGQGVIVHPGCMFYKRFQ